MVRQTECCFTDNEVLKMIEVFKILKLKFVDKKRLKIMLTQHLLFIYHQEENIKKLCERNICCHFKHK